MSEIFRVVVVFWTVSFFCVYICVSIERCINILVANHARTVSQPIALATQGQAIMLDGVTTNSLGYARASNHVAIQSLVKKRSPVVPAGLDSGCSWALAWARPAHKITNKHYL